MDSMNQPSPTLPNVPIVAYAWKYDGYLRFVTTVDTQWGGDKDRLVNDKKGYVRCVRDLE